MRELYQYTLHHATPQDPLRGTCLGRSIGRTRVPGMQPIKAPYLEDTPRTYPQSDIARSSRLQNKADNAGGLLIRSTLDPYSLRVAVQSLSQCTLSTLHGPDMDV